MSSLIDFIYQRLSLIHISASCRPEDVIAAQNFNAIRNWLYLDASVYGVYNNLVWAYLQENDACPEFADGDAEALKNGHPHFIGFNYYNTATCQESDGTETDNPVADQQTTGGVAGLYRAYRNEYLEMTEFGWEIDPVGFRGTIREIYSRYRLPTVSYTHLAKFIYCCYAIDYCWVNCINYFVFPIH